jgi:hypothetical protein
MCGRNCQQKKADKFEPNLVRHLHLRFHDHSYLIAANECQSWAINLRKAAKMKLSKRP